MDLRLTKARKLLIGSQSTSASAAGSSGSWLVGSRFCLLVKWLNLSKTSTYHLPPLDDADTSLCCRYLGTEGGQGAVTPEAGSGGEAAAQIVRRTDPEYAEGHETR